MYKSIFAAIIIFLLPLPALAGPNYLGYFEAKPDIGGARNRICIKQLPSGNLEVQITTAYCPSKECMNARLDGLLFQAKLKSNSVSYSTQSGCRLKIAFTANSAIVKHNPACQDEAHTYLYANGSYKFVKDEITEEDCSH